MVTFSQKYNQFCIHENDTPQPQSCSRRTGNMWLYFTANCVTKWTNIAQNIGKNRENSMIVVVLLTISWI